MTSNTTKTYRVGVIERAIAYYNVEAADARVAAENWADGEFYDRDDEALESEGPCNVRERQPDGKWRKVPASEWQKAAAPGTADRSARFEIEHQPEDYPDRVHVRIDGKFDVAIIRTDEGVVVDVYPKGGSETIASTYGFDSEAEAPDGDVPEAAPDIARFDSFEIEPRIRHWEDGDLERPDHSACEEHEADMWRLYGTRHGHDSVCIGEFASRAIAEDIYAGITGRRYVTSS